ncbi:sigma-E factor negative regulatory protein [Undibacterium baiyunense]|uniref:Sigma-E factor negative regulatory protein n=1 Tax=Undibacterium baiyunense TaxID=2828731 RepID=A0A941DAD0_9BURK|nr:sigma-E factor negative regulatory protein [Undibacterium baiyunense]MBR7745019.1 sigma-E factor negative regulatory protein [Undibacterium baiyunense]
MNKSNHDELISSVLDGEASDTQLDLLLARMKVNEGLEVKEHWERYHEIGDVLRSDDLAISFSTDFSKKMSALLEAEPTIVAPQIKPTEAQKLQVQKTKYWALTSVAATVMLGFLMAPQIIPLLRSSSTVDMTIAKQEAADPFAGAGVKMAANSNLGQTSKDMEFAPKLENQVEMLRDPRLDSYLLAHQKVSPSLDNGARYIQRANVVSSSDSEK